MGRGRRRDGVKRRKKKHTYVKTKSIRNTSGSGEPNRASSVCFLRKKKKKRQRERHTEPPMDNPPPPPPPLPAFHANAAVCLLPSTERLSSLLSPLRKVGNPHTLPPRAVVGPPRPAQGWEHVHRPANTRANTCVYVCICVNFTVDERGSVEPTRDTKHHRHVPQEVIVRPPAVSTADSTQHMDPTVNLISGHFYCVIRYKRV